MKLIDYQCPACGAVKEGFEGDHKHCKECSKITDMGFIIYEMQPIFSPKRNAQRWKHND